MGCCIGGAANGCAIYFAFHYCKYARCVFAPLPIAPGSGVELPFCAHSWLYMVDVVQVFAPWVLQPCLTLDWLDNLPRSQAQDFRNMAPYEGGPLHRFDVDIYMRAC